MVQAILIVPKGPLMRRTQLGRCGGECNRFWTARTKILIFGCKSADEWGGGINKKGHKFSYIISNNIISHKTPYKLSCQQRDLISLSIRDMFERGLFMFEHPTILLTQLDYRYCIRIMKYRKINTI